MITVALDSGIYPAETLLGHQEFVRKLARSLLRDDDAALDVEQETWLVALRHAPRSIESMQAWLGAIVRNRAHNRRRENERRTARELISARREADDSDEVLRDRVALAHEVVQAVLSLREPYRAIVILRYYENLSPRQIAARKNVPSGTVRVQLNRAHEMLRAKLDAQRGGDRRAWSTALGALASERAASIAVLKTATIAATCAAAIGVSIWMRRPSEPQVPRIDSIAAASSAPPPQPFDAPDRAENEFRGSAREAVIEPVAQKETIDPELASKSVRELLEMAVQTQRTLRTKLLTPDERFVREQASLLRLPSTGLARILERGKFGTDDSNALGIRGGGSCFSFATRGQSWDDEPDLALDKGALRVQGWQSCLLDLGEIPLESLPDSAAPMPSTVDESKRAAWDTMWSDAHPTDRGVDAAFEERRRRITQANAPKIGRTYLERALDQRMHDLLVAFTPLAQDDVGCTIAWRILHVWPMPSHWGARNDPYWWVADAPASIATLDAAALLSTLERIRAAAQAKLFAVPAEITTQFAAALALPSTGVARLLNSNRYQALVDGAGSGAFYSFATAASASVYASDIGLESLGYYAPTLGMSQRAFLVDLGLVPIESLEGIPGNPPARLSQRDKERWNFLTTIPTPNKGENGRMLDPETEGRGRQLAFANGIRPQPGHTCVIRSMFPNDHDVLAAFTTAAVDDAGAWIVWRVFWNRSLVGESKPR
jgi:RNA polymerase sigma-70 factor (ECF subfamily)